MELNLECNIVCPLGPFRNYAAGWDQRDIGTEIIREIETESN